MSDPEIRIDQLTGLRALLAPGRADRPGALTPERDEAPEVKPGDCVFCEGNEDKTPPEVDANRPAGGDANGPGWVTRVVPNLYPALKAEDSGDEKSALQLAEEGIAAASDPLRRASRGAEPDQFSSRPAEGAHEVIIHSPKHHRSLGELDGSAFGSAIDTWRERLRHHGDAAYCQLIVNDGKSAGASLEHTHAQLYALPFVPVAVARERERFSAYAESTNGGSLLEDIATEEVRRGERLVAIDDDAMLICPWASGGPFELRIMPRRAEPSFGESEAGAGILRTALGLLAKRFDGSPPLNLWLHTAPRRADHFHWHIDIRPRLAIRAGFEIGTGVDICTYPPERAAADLRECLE